MKVFIAGGTGTLGNELTSQMSQINDITVFSRDELKQQEMGRRFPNARFILGDIRDPEDVRDALKMIKPDVVFHVAALKQIDTMEVNPDQCIRTNILGTMVLARGCINARVPYMAFSSSDKACLPINIYGMCKSVSERYLFDLNKKQNDTRFAVFRWGNVVGSRGSAIPFFVDCLQNGRPVPITHESMTRFWIPISDAARFFRENFATSSQEKPNFPPMKAASVVRVVSSLACILGVKDYEIKITGIRPGEKIHETIISGHDFCLRSDTADQFSEADLVCLLGPYVKAVRSGE